MGCETLGARLRSLADNPLQSEVRTAAEWILLISALNATVGSKAPLIDKLLASLGRFGGDRVAPVVGRFDRVDVYGSALINATAARIPAFATTPPDPAFDIGAPIFGATLAIVATHDVRGDRLLDAFVLGYEVASRLVSIVNHYDIGWDPTGTCGAIGAGVTSALLLGATGAQITDAIGLAANQTVGQREAFGTDAGMLHAGKAAAGGAIAALLAVRGFTGPKSLDVRAGYFTVFQILDQVKINSIVNNLGSRWYFLDETPTAPPEGVAPERPLARALKELKNSRSSKALLEALVPEPAKVAKARKWW